MNFNTLEFMREPVLIRCILSILILIITLITKKYLSKLIIGTLSKIYRLPIFKEKSEINSSSQHTSLFSKKHHVGENKTNISAEHPNELDKKDSVHDTHAAASHKKGKESVTAEIIEVEKENVHLFDSVKKPINYLIVFTGLFFAVTISPFVYFGAYTANNLTVKFLDIFDMHIRISYIRFAAVTQVYRLALIPVITWLIYNTEMVYETIFNDINQKRSFINNTLIVRYLFKILRFLTVVVGIALFCLMIIPGANTIITGVGVGGLAVAFISKDSLSSLFAGLILLLDKPFVIGDWISVGTTEGIVEDISYRSTSIRTFDQSVVIIPNSTIGSANITNWSRMKKRRVSFELGIAYDTPIEKITECMNEIKKMIQMFGTKKKKGEEDLTRYKRAVVEKDSVLVNFIKFDDYSLNIQITYFPLLVDKKSYLQIQEDINLKILEICNRLGVEIAFPTQTLYQPDLIASKANISSLEAASTSNSSVPINNLNNISNDSITEDTSTTIDTSSTTADSDTSKLKEIDIENAFRNKPLN